MILDASALLALIKQERGYQTVEELLGDIVMSSVNVSEVAAILLDSDMSVQECQSVVEPLVDTIIDFDTEQSFLAGDLRKYTKKLGLSLGDRACIALGIQMKLPVYTADKIWNNLDIDSVDIRLIR